MYIDGIASVPTKNKESFKISLRIALTSAALASLDQRCTISELARIVGCHQSTIRKNADLCGVVLAGRPNLRARIAEAIELLSASNQRLTYAAIAAIAKCGLTTVQINRDLWEHLIPKQSFFSVRDSKKLMPQSDPPTEIWRMRVRNLISLNNDSLQLKERQELIVRLSWFASIAPTQEDIVWCKSVMQSLERKQAPREAVAS